MARKAGFAERGLKLALKPFLDKHVSRLCLGVYKTMADFLKAVQFYGAEGTVGRSRMKKKALI
jgi:hypothetical protein